MKKSIYFLILFCCVLPLSGAEFRSLKYQTVNMRTGPGERFPVKYVYHRRHYPMQVIDTYDGWVQVQEKDATTGWIRETQLSKVPYIVVLEEADFLYKPHKSADIIGKALPGVIGKVHACPPEGAYCLIIFQAKQGEKEHKGWIEKKYFWGIDKNQVID